MTHSLIINRMIFLNDNTDRQYDGNNDVNADDDEWGAYHCQLLCWVVDEPIIAVVRIVLSVSTGGLIEFFKLSKFNIIDIGAHPIFDHHAVTVAMHQT